MVRHYTEGNDNFSPTMEIPIVLKDTLHSAQGNRFP